MNNFVKVLKNYFSDFLKNITFEKIMVRLVMSWLLTTIAMLFKWGKAFDTAKLAAGINMPMYVCFVILFLIAFCAMGKFKVFEWVETFGPMILITMYGFLTVQKNTSTGYMLGVGIFLAVAIAYAVNKVTVFAEIKKRSTVIIISVVASLFFISYVGAIAVLRYVTYRNPNYDFGIWSQMFYYMKNTFKPLTTCERAEYGLISHFAVHFSPIYYLYLPFYYIFPYPVTLNVLQVLTLAAGVIPLMLLCKHKGLSKAATAAFAVIFFMFPALSGGTFYDLHENCFLVPMLLWLFYFVEKDNLKGIIIFTVLTLLIKEDAAIYPAFIGIYMAVGLKNYAKGAIVGCISVAYFLIVSMFMSKYGLGIMDNRFSNYMVNSATGSLVDVIRNFIANPAYVLEQSFAPKKIEFMFLMFAPLGFLSFASKKASRVILFIPVILINLASNYQYQYSIFFQYVFGSIAILFYLAVVNYSELSEKVRRFMGYFAICMAIVVAPACALSKKYYFDVYSKEKTNIAELNAAMETIPQDASVIASTFFLPHLSDRDEIYEYRKIDKLTDYVVLDIRWSEVKDSDIKELEDKGYKIVDRKNSLYVILKYEANSIDF